MIGGDYCLIILTYILAKQSQFRMIEEFRYETDNPTRYLNSFVVDSARESGKYSRFHVDEVHPDCSPIAVGTRQCRVPTSVVYLTNLKSAVLLVADNR